MAETVTVPHRISLHLAKYAGDPQPGQEPEEVIDTVAWFEGDGTPVTDPARAAALDATLEEEPPCP